MMKDDMQKKLRMKDDIQKKCIFYKMRWKITCQVRRIFNSNRLTEIEIQQL